MAILRAMRQSSRTDLGIRYTTVVPGLWVGLVLTIAIAAGGTTTHFGETGGEGNWAEGKARPARGFIRLAQPVDW